MKKPYVKVLVFLREINVCLILSRGQYFHQFSNLPLLSTFTPENK